MLRNLVVILVLFTVFNCVDVYGENYRIKIKENYDSFDNSSTYNIDIRDRTFSNLFQSPSRRFVHSILKGLNAGFEYERRIKRYRAENARMLANTAVRIREAQLLEAQTELARYQLQQLKVAEQRKAAERRRSLKPTQNVVETRSRNAVRRLPERKRRMSINPRLHRAVQSTMVYDWHRAETAVEAIHLYKSRPTYSLSRSVLLYLTNDCKMAPNRAERVCRDIISVRNQR